MGLWGAIKKSINSDLTKPLNTLINSVQTTVNTIDTNTARGVIKSVQRGSSSGNTSNTPGYTSISIVPLTSSKFEVIIDGAYGTYRASGGSIAYSVPPRRGDVTGSTLIIYPADTSLLGYTTLSSNTFSWQLIEYY